MDGIGCITPFAADIGKDRGDLFVFERHGSAVPPRRHVVVVEGAFDVDGTRNAFMKNGNQAIFRANDPLGASEGRIDPCLPQAAGLVALGTVGGIQAFSNDLGVRRCHWTRVDWSPRDLAWIEHIPAETTAVKEKIATRPEG